MQIRVKIIKVEVVTKPGKTGNYQSAKVAYEDLDKGKLSQKTLQSFVFPEVFKAISKAVDGDIFTIEIQKDEAGFWQWIEIQSGNQGSVDKAPVQAETAKSSYSPKSTYETPEERAQKQIYIIRQSSVATAERLHSIGAKTPPAIENVIQTSKQIEQYVFGIEAASFANLKADKLEEEIEVE